MPPSYYSQPMAPWIPTEEYSMDTAHGLEDRSLPRDLASFTPTQLYSSHTMNVYPSLPTGAERTLAYAPFPMDLPSFPTSNGFPAGEPPNIERIDSGPQSEAEGVESDPEYIDSESEPEDHPLPADAAHWISMSPAQFDREYPGGNLFVIEELNLNLDSEEGAPYVELDGVRALNRIFIIFYAVEWALFPYAFTDTHHEIIWGVLADLLKDGKVWLWVDGDEEKCADLHGDTSSYPSLTKSLQYVKQKLSCSSLRLRKPRLPTWTSLWERVSKASFAKRVSAIIWATFTSVAVRETGWERGRADWTRCALRGEVWKLYYHVLGGLGARDLLVEGRHSHLEVAFKDNLRCHGHSCFTCLPEYLEEPLKFLLYLQSFLCSTPSGKDISMILFIISGSSCQQCAKLQELYMSSKDAHYTPPLSLVVLNALRWSLAIVTPVWLRILALVVSRGMISAAILSKLDDEIRLTHLGTDTFDFQYQPWVNRLPRSLRSSVVTCSESEWRQAELAVRRENQHQSVPTSRWDSMDIGFGVRITAIYLLMSEHSPQKLTPRKYWIDCCQRSVWDEMFDDAVYPAHISASVEAFCDATSESWDASTHTCCEFGWGVHSLKLRQCYAAAYLLLHPESQDVPLLEPLQRPVDCPWQWKRRFGCEMCPDCAECRKLPEAEPVVPLVLVVQISELRDTTPSVEGMDDIGPTSAIVLPNPQVSAVPQMPLGSGQHRGPPLSKDVILPKLKDHFAKLLAQYDIPIQYTNLGAPQLPWCSLPELLRNRRLEIAGWPEDLPLPDANGKHNAKGIMGLTAKDARRLHGALPGISFRPIVKARARSREEESEDDIGNRPMKKVKGKGKAPAEGEKKFRLSEVQTVIPDIRVGKSN